MSKSKLSLLILAIIAFLNTSCNQEKPIKAFCLDFNWGKTGTWAFAENGAWASANPEAQVKWYKDLGANTIQTFCVSAHGYAWYKGSIVPEEPGLKYDYLRDMVRLGHKENMKVMGYFCIGSNTRWGKENPDYSYGCSPKLNPKLPTNCHIPYTKRYLSYLDSAICDAVKNTGIDGFMIDWVWQPTRESTNGKWIDCEKKLYEEIMQKEFPGEDSLSEEDYNTYSRIAIERCWDTIYKATKETNPKCIIWLSCNNVSHPHVINSKMFKEVDWLINEAGDLEGLNSIKNMVGAHTQLLTCFAEWNKKDAKTIVPEAFKNGMGIYGFAQPHDDALLFPINHYLSLPIDSFKGDNRNVATLARAFNNLPFDYLRNK